MHRLTILSMLGPSLLGCGGFCLGPSCLPRDLPPFDVTELDLARATMADGHLLLTLVDDRRVSYVAVIDRTGTPVWWWTPEEPELRVIRARPSADGQTVSVSLRRWDNRFLDGAIVRVDVATGDVMQRYETTDLHHEHVDLGDGRIAYLSRERIEGPWFDIDAPLASDLVVVIDEASGTETVAFDIIDDLGIEPYWSCDHMSPRGFVEGALDWTHTNSLAYEPQTDSFTIGIRHFDAMVRVSAAGRAEWWLGTPLGGLGGFGRSSSLLVPGMLDALDGAEPPRHGHFGEAEADRLLVFDNGPHNCIGGTRIVDYAIDTEARTYREVWSYAEPRGRCYQARGDAVRLPNGHRIVVWSGSGEIWEITPEGDIVWAADNALKVLRVTYLPNWP